MYRELKMTKDEFFELVQELGFDIGERAIKIDDAVAVKIIQAIKKQRKNANKKSIFDDETTKKEEKKETTDGDLIALPEKITVKTFAEKMGKAVPDMIAILMRNGIMATINESLDYETAAIIAEDLGYKATLSMDAEDIDNPDDRSGRVAETLEGEKKSSLKDRPPVIVIMGHVDHGKTTLLDAIRETNVVDGESGGITQHIGAYQVERKKKLLTFIDTPGHEAFTTMRSRGARVADIAILVVAADDGLKPQTIESIHILQEAELPFVVAINKIDKESADIERVKKELAEVNLIPEDYGGDVVCTPISAKDGQNIDELLDTVLLVAEVEKDGIVANPKGQTVGSIIESHVDKHSGPVATVLVQNGTLHIGDIVSIGSIPGKVRSMKDWNGQEMKDAPPSTPVQVLGLKKAPVVGDILEVVADKKVLKQKVKAYDSFSFLKSTKKQEGSGEDGKKTLPIILRADKLGSLEAIVQSLHNIQHEEVGIEIIQKGLGSITENDVSMAQAADALVFGFHVGATAGAEKFARDEEVEVVQYNIIYELIDHVKGALEGLLDKAVSYNKIGELKVLAVFKTGTNHVIGGGRVQDGELRTDAPVKIMRGGKKVAEGFLGQLQMEKKNVGKVKSGNECGLRVNDTTELQEGDIIEAYEQQQEARKLEE